MPQNFARLSLNTLSRIKENGHHKCFCITSMHDMLGAIGLIQMRAKRTKPHFHQPQVFNRSKQSCDRRTLSRAICWYVLMLPEHLSVRWHALMSSWLLAPPQSDTATEGAANTFFRWHFAHACLNVYRIVVTLQGPNVPVWFSPEYLFDLIFR
jgi:hypothetical protein